MVWDARATTLQTAFLLGQLFSVGLCNRCQRETARLEEQRDVLLPASLLWTSCLLAGPMSVTQASFLLSVSGNSSQSSSQSNLQFLQRLQAQTHLIRPLILRQDCMQASTSFPESPHLTGPSSELRDTSTSWASLLLGARILCLSSEVLTT